MSSRRWPPYQRKVSELPTLPRVSELADIPPSKIRQQIEKIRRELDKHSTVSSILSRQKWICEKKLNIWRAWSDEYCIHNRPILEQIDAIRKADLAEQKRFWSSNSIEAYRKRNRLTFYKNEPAASELMLSELFVHYEPPRLYLADMHRDHVVAVAFVQGVVALTTAIWWADLQGRKSIPFGTELTPNANERILRLSASLQFLPCPPSIDETKAPGHLGKVAISNRQAKLALLQEGLALSEKIWLESAEKQEAVQRIDKIIARNRRKQALRMRSLLESQFQLTFDCPYCGADLGSDPE